LFAEDGFGQDSEIRGDFRGAGWAAFYSMMSEQGQFGAAKFTRFEVLPNERSEHRRESLRTEREQRRRRRTGGRFSECELSL